MTSLPDQGYSPSQGSSTPLSRNHSVQAAQNANGGAVSGRLAESFSFKRKQKQPAPLNRPARILEAVTGNRVRFDVPPESPGIDPPDLEEIREPAFSSPKTARRIGINASRNGAGTTKDGLAMDWQVEGPGRRVGYEDLTAIDWIFEYTKERERQRLLASGATGLRGYVAQLADASQTWIVLVLTGLTVGVIAAAIDVATDFLGDLKSGFCTSDDGGAFYLSKSFCCYGYDEKSKCIGWRGWAAALDITSKGGVWFTEYLFFLGFSVTFAVAAAVLVKDYAIWARHSGIPELKTILGGFVIERFLGTWTLVIKPLGLCLAVGSGMWLGKEGPLVHVACACASLFIKLFPAINDNEARKREVLSAAAASGISVAFGSPVGGVLFSLEQLSYYFPDRTMWQSFVCAMMAAVALQALDPFRSGQLVLYHVTYSTGWHSFELVPFALLGIVGGLFGGLFIKANMAVAKWRKSSASWLPGPVTQVLVVALLTAIVNYPNLYMRAQTSELVSNLLKECATITDDQFGLCKTGAATVGTIILLLFAAFLGFILSAITFGLQIPAGIILPSMAIGALTGRAVGILMEIWVHNQPDSFLFSSCEPDLGCITPGTYAVIGAAATLAGVTRMTVSIVVITFELTGALVYVLPIMIAVMISKWVGDAFSRRGIYESWIHFNEYPHLDHGEEHAIPDVAAGSVMTRIEDLVVLTATGHTIASLSAILEDQPYRGYPVVSDPRDAILLGYISRAELSYNLKAATSPPRSLPPDTEAFFSPQPLSDVGITLDLRPWMDQTPLTLPARANLHLAVQYFQKLGVRYMLFCDKGVLQGLLTKKDVWYILDGAENQEKQDGSTAPIVGAVNVMGGIVGSGSSDLNGMHLANSLPSGRLRASSRGSVVVPSQTDVYMTDSDLEDQPSRADVESIL